MGYSIRTVQWRYTLWLLVDRAKLMPIWAAPFFSEELYDHRDESLADLGTRETQNVAGIVIYKPMLSRMRNRLVSYLRNELVYVRDVGLPPINTFSLMQWLGWT